jgi:hypothetical protein
MTAGCTRNSASMIFSFLLLCGCTHQQYTGMETLASGFEQPWPGSHSASMTMTVLDSEGHTVLHCRLRNLSSRPLVLDRSRLPWNTPMFFTGTVLTSRGRTFPIAPPLIVAQVMAMPSPISIGPHQALEGNLELKYLPKNPMAGPPIPRDVDALLMWSYDLSIYGQTRPQGSSANDERQIQAVRVVGVTFLADVPGSGVRAF